MSKFVFDLSDEYRNILKYLAQKGPSNLNNISRFTELSEEHRLQRWAVKRRIHGTPVTKGLISHQYVYVKKENKKRYGKQETSYHLTAKGIIASISSTSLDKNYFFQSKLDFISNFPLVNLTQDFISEYISLQINAFLAYHYVHGMQLTWMRDFITYYHRFVERFHSEELEDYFGADIVKKDFDPRITEYKKKFLSYKISHGKLDPLEENLSILYWNDEESD